MAWILSTRRGLNLFLPLLFLNGAWANPIPSQSPDVKANTDDRDAIQTSLLSFFKREKWHSADWKTTTYVVLNPKYRVKTRPSYPSVLSELIADAKRELEAAKSEKAAAVAEYVVQAKRDLKALTDVQMNFLMSVRYVVVPPKPISSFTWDKRIWVTDEARRRFDFGRPKNSNPKLKQVGVFAYVSPPCYSGDGVHCIVSMNIPWSIHSADVSFVLTRSAYHDGWSITVVRSMFYV